MASGVLFKSNSQLFGKAMTYDADAAVEEVGLFDMDLENGSTWSPTRKVASSVDLSKLQQDMATLETICDASSVKEDVILRRVRRVLKGEEGWNTTTAIAKLESLGYQVELGHSRKMKRDIFRTRPHSFVRLDADKGLSIIIDTNFRASFAVARSSFYYSKVFEQLPNVFVGSEDRLRLLVFFMSEQLNRNFVEMSMPCPPWREKSSLLNTWAL